MKIQVIKQMDFKDIVNIKIKNTIKYRMQSRIIIKKQVLHLQIKLIQETI